MSGKSISDYMGEAEDRKLKQRLLSSKLSGGGGTSFTKNFQFLKEQFPELPDETIARIAQNRMGTDLTFGPNGEVINMAGSLSALMNKAYAEQTGTEVATTENKVPRELAIEQNKAGVEISAAAPKAKQTAIGAGEGGVIAKRLEDATKAGTAGAQMMATTDRVRSLVKQGIYGVAPVDRLKMMGSEISADLAADPKVINTKKVIAFGSQLQKDAVGGTMGSGISNADMEILSRVGFGLSKPQSPEFVLSALDELDGVAARNVGVADYLNKKLEQTGSIPSIEQTQADNPAKASAIKPISEMSDDELRAIAAGGQ